MPVARIDDVDVYYEVEGEGEWAVFVHGGGGTHLSWWQQVHALRDCYRCLTYDTRGSGQTGGTANAASGDRELIGLMDHLGIERAFLNGWSAGGSAVSRVSQHHPDRVHALVMTCCVFGFQTAALARWAGEMLERFAAGATIADRVRPPDVARDDPESHFLNEMLGRLNAAVRPLDAEGYADRFGDAYRAMRDAPPVDYAGFRVPSLFVVGEHDELQLPWLVRSTAEAVPGAAIVEIPSSGHGPPCEKPGIYNSILMAFMGHHDPRRQTGSAGN